MAIKQARFISHLDYATMFLNSTNAFRTQNIDIANISSKYLILKDLVPVELMTRK